jgi:hypothetical protein
MVYCAPSVQGDVIRDVASFCNSRQVSLVAYSGDRIVCEATDKETDRLVQYWEPEPEAVGNVRQSKPRDLL